MPEPTEFAIDRTLDCLYPAAADPDAWRTDLARTLSLAALDALDIPVFAVDAEGHLKLANQRGEEHLRSGGLLTLYGGRLGTIEQHVGLRLRTALGAAAARCAQAFSVATPTTRWMVRVVPLTRHSGMVLIYLGYSGRSTAGESALLHQVFGFSEAEADVASQLVAGIRPKAIAVRRGVAESTVRAQIRQVLQKAGVRSIADLATVISALPPVIAPDAARGARESSGPAVLNRTLEIHDPKDRAPRAPLPGQRSPSRRIS